MTHLEIIEKINQSDISDDKRRRGMILSYVETLKNILISKGIVSETEYNSFLDENLLRNFNEFLK